MTDNRERSVTLQYRLQVFSAVSSFEKKKGQSKHPNATWQEKQEWDVPPPLPIAQPAVDSHLAEEDAELLCNPTLREQASPCRQKQQQQKYTPQGPLCVL